ncbi:methyltransferase [Streptomyces alkaliphilus]|uniref:Methyltransferase n=1 Tax=Streptomyces alkaliphilus TaxID=1472722 RepID=A0A7W3T9Q0_9ACTN|nr:methyltransferase [Streptomyces alkaliphilus]MBB0242856.1 methyltransferase [Streptomyces alkaliphilus]
MRMLLYGQLVSKVLCAAVRLGVPEALSGGGRRVAEVAREVGAHTVALHRLLRALASFDVVEEADGAFSLTSLGSTLLPDTPGTAHPTAMLLANEVGATWAEFDHTLRTGDSAFRHLHGSSLFDHLERQPERRTDFDLSQEAGLRLELDEIFEFVTFDRYQSIVDVGGGNGHLMCELLHRTPGSSGVILDLSGTVSLAEKRVAEEELTHRCTALAGDFFIEVSPGADLYILSHVLHDWGDEDAVKILRTCASAMPDSGRLMVIDLAMTSPTAPAGTSRAPGGGEGSRHLPALMDLYMLSLFGAAGGRERTTDEFVALLSRAGLDAEDISVLPSGMAVITARAHIS